MWIEPRESHGHCLVIPRPLDDSCSLNRETGLGLRRICVAKDLCQREEEVKMEEGTKNTWFTFNRKLRK